MLKFIAGIASAEHKDGSKLGVGIEGLAIERCRNQIPNTLLLIFVVIFILLMYTVIERPLASTCPKISAGHHKSIS